jgi:DNA-binding FadR family transcriptional regulator
MFNASRGSLREALRVLEQKGLITVKTGVSGGIFVKEVTTDLVSESLDLLLRYQGVSLRELAEFRETLEGIVAGLAAQKASVEDVQNLKEILTEAKTYLEKGATNWAEFIQKDSQFHTALANIAENRLYTSVLKTVYDNMHRYHDKFLPPNKRIMKMIYKHLNEITNAVEKSQADKASSLAQQHVNQFHKLAEENKYIKK